MTLLSDSAFSLDAQLVIVREAPDASDREDVLRLAQQHRCVCAFSEPGGGRGAMADQAMRVATGDIVVLREDVEVGDGKWLSALPRRARAVADAERSIVSPEERSQGTVRPLADRSAKAGAPVVRRRAEAVTPVPG